MNIIKKNGPGFILCIILAIPSWILGKTFPIIGGPIIAILIGMIISIFFKDQSRYEAGIKYTSKKILQYAVILLGFGLNFSVVLETGKQSLPIIISTITTSLVIAFILHKVMDIPARISTLQHILKEKNVMPPPITPLITGIVFLKKPVKTSFVILTPNHLLTLFTIGYKVPCFTYLLRIV